MGQFVERCGVVNPDNGSFCQLPRDHHGAHSAQMPDADPALERLRADLREGRSEETMHAATEMARRSEDTGAYERAAQAYLLASDAAYAIKRIDVANKFQRLAGKMYLLLAENARDTTEIRRGYAQSAKIFLTAGNLKLSNDAAERLEEAG